MSAKEKALMDHTAAKEKMKSIREEERRRDNPQSSSSTAPNRDLDSIMNDVQQNCRYKDNRQQDRSRDWDRDRNRDCDNNKRDRYSNSGSSNRRGF